MKLQLKMNFGEYFRKPQISILVVKGLDNSVMKVRDPYFKSLLDKERSELMTLSQTRTSPRMKSFRSGGRPSANSRPRKEHASIEALLKRFSQGVNFIQSIPLVDIYNSVSLSYAVPCGGEDLDKRLSEVFI